MSKSIEQFRAELISKGMLVAAERLVASSKPVVPSPVATPDILSPVVPVGMLKVFCAKTSCRNFMLQAKGQGKRFFCADHNSVSPAVVAEPVTEPEPEIDDDSPVLYHHGNLYEPHIINFDGVAFRQRNGKVITLDPSKVEWVRPPKY